MNAASALLLDLLGYTEVSTDQRGLLHVSGVYWSEGKIDDDNWKIESVHWQD
jgi:hypothetical protein